MKFFHTADWHLGKLVQGMSMIEDQTYVLKHFIQCVSEEKPDAVIIAGDLYDRAVPPTEAVNLLDDVLDSIVLDLKIPVLAIAGNHDSPSRLQFGSKIMKEKGFYIVGEYSKDLQPVILSDPYGDVYFHLVPYTDPSIVRRAFNNDHIRTHQDAAEAIVKHIQTSMDPTARHVYVGHAFVTPYGEEAENTSDSERPLSIGGAEYVNAQMFQDFHYTALGHLHRAHYVYRENIRYSGSLLKYSMSEARHEKGFYVVELDKDGQASVEKRVITPRRDLKIIEATMDELLQHPVSEDYVFVKLLDETPVLSPMEKIRSVYPNAMHVERKRFSMFEALKEDVVKDRGERSDLELFKAFYKEMKGKDAPLEVEALFKELLEEQLQVEREVMSGEHSKDVVRQ